MSRRLGHKYLEEGDLTEEEIKLGIRTRTIASEIQPMYCGSAFKNKGVQRMLKASRVLCHLRAKRGWLRRQRVACL